MSKPFLEKAAKLAPIINLSERGLSLHIQTDQAQHVFPVAYFRKLAAGEPVEPLPDDVLRTIIEEWLTLLGVDL